MFGLGMGELIVIAVVALLFLGPDRLPAAAKSLGQGIRTLRKQSRDLQETIEKDSQLGDAMREIRSALHDEPEFSRPKPRNKVPDHHAAATPADETESDGALSAEAMDAAADAAAAQAAADEAELPAQESEPAGEAEPPMEEGMPLIRPAEGAIARNSLEDEAPSGDPKSES